MLKSIRTLKGDFWTCLLLILVLFAINNCGANKHAVRTTLLYDAVYKGHIEEARTLISQDNGVDTPVGESRITPLLLASQKGLTELVTLLLDNGANIEAKDNFGRTALMWASINGHLDTARLLVKRGVVMDGKSTNGMTALLYASAYGHLDIVLLLVGEGPQIKDRSMNEITKALFVASEKGYDKIVESLILRGADINVRDKIERTPLFIALWNGRSNTAKLLIKNGADINTKASNGVTPLMAASRSGLINVVRLLKSKGANLGLKSNDGSTALNYAARNGRTRVCGLLLDSGVTLEVLSGKPAETGKDYYIAAEHERDIGNTKVAMEYYLISVEQYELAAKRTRNKMLKWDYHNRAIRYRKRGAELSKTNVR